MVPFYVLVVDIPNLVVWDVFRAATAADEYLAVIFPIDTSHRVAVPALHPTIIATAANFRLRVGCVHIPGGLFRPSGCLRFLSKIDFNGFCFLGHCSFSVVLVGLDLNENLLDAVT